MTLAAPTGRAAKRMTETSGHPAQTIHRLIGFGSEKPHHEPIKGDVLILDECSMIDVSLMARLLEALPETMRLVLCGDVDQLPSVGPGCVFRDIIDSGEIPTVRLETIFRQSKQSAIVLAAHEINRGIIPEIRNDKDLYFQPVHAEESQDKGEASLSSSSPNVFRIVSPYRVISSRCSARCERWKSVPRPSTSACRRC